MGLFIASSGTGRVMVRGCPGALLVGRRAHPPCGPAGERRIVGPAAAEGARTRKSAASRVSIAVLIHLFTLGLHGFRIP